MKRKTMMAFISTAFALVVGCHSAGGDLALEEQSRPAISLEQDEIPPDLDRCRHRFGDRAHWPQPDSLYGIAAQPDAVVLVLDGAPLCRTELARLMQQPPSEMKQAEVYAISGGPTGDGSQAESPTDDSNPLPAIPPRSGGDVAADSGDPGDSNPLPADNGSQDDGEQAGDSNPLPARGDGGDPASNQVDDSNPLPARARPIDEHGDRFEELNEVL